MQVSVYDTINKDAQYSLKVRRLGEYHSGLAATKDQEGQDIGDPLYGNVGGVDELVGTCFALVLTALATLCWMAAYAPLTVIACNCAALLDVC